MRFSSNGQRSLMDVADTLPRAWHLSIKPNKWREAKMWVPWLTELPFRVERHHFLAYWKVINCIQKSRENLGIPWFKYCKAENENMIRWAGHMCPRGRWKDLIKWHGKEWPVIPLFNHQTQGPHFINPATVIALRTTHVCNKCPWDESFHKPPDRTHWEDTRHRI